MSEYKMKKTKDKINVLLTMTKYYLDYYPSTWNHKELCKVAKITNTTKAMMIDLEYITEIVRNNSDKEFVWSGGEINQIMVNNLFEKIEQLSIKNKIMKVEESTNDNLKETVNELIELVKTQSKELHDLKECNKKSNKYGLFEH